MSDVLIHGAFVISLLLLLHVTRPAYLAFRKRRSGYGTVFNSSTGIPEALASVRIKDLHGQVVRTAVTDKHGRYRLMIPKGEYVVDVVKPNFSFPSKYIGKKSVSSVYDNLLPATHIIVKDYGVMTKNIPIDPADASRSSIFRRGIRLGKDTQYAIAFLSPFVAFGIASLVGTWVSFATWGAYVAVLLKRLLTFKPAAPPFGTVRDAATHEPLANVVVRAFESKYNKLLETQVTSAKGRYAFIVRPGAYRILFRKNGYKTVMMNYPHIRKDGYVITKNVVMKRLPPGAPPEPEEPVEAAPASEAPPPPTDLG